MRIGGGQAAMAGPAQDARAVLDHVRLVVHDQDPGLAHARAGSTATGKLSVNVVPAPGRDSTSTVPW